MLKNDLPEIYQGLLSDEILNLSPNETLATCQDCYKAKKSAPAPHYDPRLKCCTYYPFIPNYLVGALLSENNSQGEWGGALKVLQELILNRRYVLPIGICAPPAYQKLFRSKTAEDFGNRDDLLCPFYKIKTGGCSVWKFRGHECATFFCVSSYGKQGEDFWQGMRDYLFDVEMELSQACMTQKGYTSKEIDLNLEFIKRPVDDKVASFDMTAIDWSNIWQHHHDNIEEYFKKCFQFVRSCKSELKTSLNERPYSAKINQGLFKPPVLGGSL